MKDTLESMGEDVTGKILLARLKLDGFGHYSDSLFNEIRAMVKTIQRADPKHSLLPTD
jgi:hypothetical protein